MTSNAILPTRSTPNSAGYDIYSSNEVKVCAGQRAVVNTGIAVKIPDGYCGFIKSRSGLFLNHNIVAFAGTIDSDYVGDVKIILINMSDGDFIVSCGMRFAQLAICKIYTGSFNEVDILPVTKHGDNGFGSSGYY